MFANLTGWHALILIAVVLLLFGATRLPALARSIGQSARIFKTEVGPRQPRSDEAATNAPAPAPAEASAEPRVAEPATTDTAARV